MRPPSCVGPVYGSGPVPADVLVLGEAPGADEDDKGVPFIGRSGQLLRDALQSVGIDPKSVYITNSVKCRPPGNRKPKTEELEACDPWFQMEVQEVKPKLIVAVGQTSIERLFGKGVSAKYTEQEGVLKSGKPKLRPITLEEARRRDDLVYGPLDIPVIVCFHPAAALRSPRYKSGFYRDIEKVAERLGIKRAEVESVDYGLASSDDSLWIEDVPVALDTEYDMETGELVCYSYSYEAKRARVVFVDESDAIPTLAMILYQAPNLIFHNGPADIPKIAKFLGVGLDGFWERWGPKVEDTIIQNYLLGKKPLSLKGLAENELGMRVIRLEDILDPGQRVADIPRDKIIGYAAQDADITIRIWHKARKEINDASGR